MRSSAIIRCATTGRLLTVTSISLAHRRRELGKVQSPYASEILLKVPHPRWLRLRGLSRLGEATTKETSPGQRQCAALWRVSRPTSGRDLGSAVTCGKG